MISAIALLCAFAGQAHAATHVGYKSEELPPYGSFHGPPEALDDSYAQGEHSIEGYANAVCAGARFISGGFYAHYFCAHGYACHDYGGEALEPKAHNHENFYGLVTGFYSSSPDYYYRCPHGSTVNYRTASPSPSGTVLPAAAQLKLPDGRVCLRIADVVGAGSTCMSKEEAGAGKLMGTLENGPGQAKSRVLAAVAPTGASFALIIHADGSRSSVSVVNGIAEAPLPDGTTKIVWRTPSGKQTISVKPLS
jgi:hypothetical protein